MSRDLHIWTIYDHPRDCPDAYIARKFVVNGKGTRPTSETITSPDLGFIRNSMINSGLTCIGRERKDDPKIVESWL